MPNIQDISERLTKVVQDVEQDAAVRSMLGLRFHDLHFCKEALALAVKLQAKRAKLEAEA